MGIAALIDTLIITLSEDIFIKIEDGDFGSDDEIAGNISADFFCGLQGLAITGWLEVLWTGCALENRMHSAFLSFWLMVRTVRIAEVDGLEFIFIALIGSYFDFAE